MAAKPQLSYGIALTLAAALGAATGLAACLGTTAHTGVAPAPSGSTVASPTPAPGSTSTPGATPGATSSASPAASPTPFTVSIQGIAYHPASFTVSAGTTIVFTNNDGGIPHSVTSDSGAWIDTGTFTSGSKSITLGQKGTFTYHCTVHPTEMTGTITVQ